MPNPSDLQRLARQRLIRLFPWLGAALLQSSLMPGEPLSASQQGVQFWITPVVFLMEERQALSALLPRRSGGGIAIQRKGLPRYAWQRQFAKAMSGGAGEDADIRPLKRALARVSEERDM
jgi:hypothetical protein